MLYHCGLNTQVFATNFDTIIIGSVVKVLLPIKFKNAAEHRCVQTPFAGLAQQGNIQGRGDCTPNPSKK